MKIETQLFRYQVLKFLYDKTGLILDAIEETKGRKWSFKKGTLARQVVDKARTCIEYSPKTINADIFAYVTGKLFDVIDGAIFVDNDGYIRQSYNIRREKLRETIIRKRSEIQTVKVKQAYLKAKKRWK